MFSIHKPNAWETQIYKLISYAHTLAEILYSFQYSSVKQIHDVVEHFVVQRLPSMPVCLSDSCRRHKENFQTDNELNQLRGSVS